MKKSFIFGITMVLTLLLVFAGCSQSTSSDDDPVNPPGGGDQISLQNDLPAIAAAFSDGATVVTVKSDLYLNDGEVVIPYGKTLRFEGAGITGLTHNSKIIGAGRLEGLSAASVDLTKYAGAKLIVTAAFKDSYVHVRLDTEEASGKPIVANEEQIVYIQSFTDLLAHATSPGSVSGFYAYDGIVALETPGPIGTAEAAALAINTKGQKVYIVGDVAFLSDIEFKNEGTSVPQYQPPASASRGILANYDTSLDESGKHTLVIAGDVDVNGKSVEADGFTVWGTLKDGTSGTGKHLTIGKTPLRAYTAKLTKPIFEGPVHFYGPISNGFDLTVTFKDDVTIDGAVSFTEAQFEGNATFNGHVTFSDRGATGVRFVNADTATPAGTKTVSLRSGAEIQTDITFGGSEYEGYTKFYITGNAPVKFKDGFLPKKTTFTRIVEGGSLSQADTSLIPGRIELSPPANTVLGEAPNDYFVKYYNVTVRNPVKIGTVATFEGTTVFEDNVTFGTKAAFDTKGASLIVRGNATFGTEAVFINSLTVDGTAEFKTKDVNFGSASYSINKLLFGTNGYFRLGTASAFDEGKATRAIGEAVFTAGTYSDIGTQGIVINGISFEADNGTATGTASLIVPKDVTVTIGGDKIEVKGGHAQLLNTLVTLKSGQSINPVGSKSELAFYTDTGFVPTEAKAGIKITGVLGRTGEFKVTGGSAELNSGKLAGLNNAVVAVTLNKDTELTVPLQGTLQIGTASLDVSKGSIVLGGTEAGAGAGSYSAIHLINGTLSTGSAKTKKAYGGDAYILAGSTGLATPAIALIGSASNGAWGTYSSNLISSEISFVGSEGLAAGSEAAINADAEVLASKIVFGSLGTE